MKKYSNSNMALVLVLAAMAAGPSHAFVPNVPTRVAATPKGPFAAATSSSLWESSSKNGDQKRVTVAEEPSTPQQKQQHRRTPALPSAVVATAALAMALAIAPLPSDAAMSGGRMGGSFSAPSRSYSSPGRTYSAPSYSRGYRSGYLSRPSVAITPMVTPYAPISPFGYSPFYRPYSYGSPGIISVRGPSFFPLLVLGGMAFAVANYMRNMGSAGTSFLEDASGSAVSALGPGTSVVQLSVALDVPNRDDSNSILMALNRLANTARTDSRVGVQNLSSQVALELLRRKSSIVSANSRYHHFNRREQAQRDFESISIMERSKFEHETVNKYKGVDYAAGSSQGGTVAVGDKATMVVVTLILEIDGDSTKLPKIRSIRDVEDALCKIASDAKVSDCLQGAEILWTPEDRTETLSKRDVVADYPELATV